MRLQLELHHLKLSANDKLCPTYLQMLLFVYASFEYVYMHRDVGGGNVQSAMTCSSKAFGLIGILHLMQEGSKLISIGA